MLVDPFPLLHCDSALILSLYLSHLFCGDSPSADLHDPVVIHLYPLQIILQSLVPLKYLPDILLFVPQLLLQLPNLILFVQQSLILPLHSLSRNG